MDWAQTVQIWWIPFLRSRVSILIHFNILIRQRNTKTLRLTSFITEENKNRIAKIRGLAWGVTKADIVIFFHEFGIAECDVVIELEEGKNTGYALVFMKD